MQAQLQNTLSQSTETPRQLACSADQTSCPAEPFTSEQDFLLNGRYVTTTAAQNLLCENCHCLPLQPMTCPCKKSLWCRKCIVSILKSEGISTNGVFLNNRPVCGNCRDNYQQSANENRRKIQPWIRDISAALVRSGYNDIYEYYSDSQYKFSTVTYQPAPKSRDKLTHQLYKCFSEIYGPDFNQFMEYANFNIEKVEELFQKKTFVDLGPSNKKFDLTDQQAPDEKGEMVFDFYDKVGLKIKVKDPKIREPVSVRCKSLLNSHMFDRIRNDKFPDSIFKGNHVGSGSNTFVIDTSCPVNNVTVTIQHCWVFGCIRLTNLLNIGLKCFIIDGNEKPTRSETVKMTTRKDSAMLKLPVLKSSMIIDPYLILPSLSEEKPQPRKENPLIQYETLPVFTLN